MQLPFSCHRKPVPFEVLRSTEYRIFTLYRFAVFWNRLNENTSQRVFATYLHFWATLKLYWNV